MLFILTVKKVVNAYTTKKPKVLEKYPNEEQIKAAANWEEI